MPTLNRVIADLVVGDDLQVTRTIENLAASVLLTKAWLTFLAEEDDVDADKIFQKIITIADVPGTGQITESGTGTPPARTGKVRFDLTKVDTLKLLPGKVYFYDIQVELDSADDSTPETGTCVPNKQRTRGS